LKPPLFEIHEFAVLNALSRALVEAKFHLHPNDSLVPASPFVADLANDVADALEEHVSATSVHSSADPGSWRDPSNHPEKLEAVRARLEECKPWSEWTADQKRKYVRLLLAPLRPVADTVSQLLEDADKAHGAASM